MSSLLSRFAANAFWLGRYLERAESLARIIDINESFARDHPKGPDWEPVLELYSDRERFLETHDDINADTVLAFYVLDQGNPSSLAYAIHHGRENARTVRHLISTEMWTHLNVFHHRLKSLTKRDIWPSSLATLCAEIKLSCQTFEGIAEGTFFRGEAWSFYQIGKYLERADQTTRVLDMGYDRLSDKESGTLAAMHRDVLVRSVSGYHAFRSRYPVSDRPVDIAMFLLYDAAFPRAVGLCVNQLISRLRTLDQMLGHDDRSAVEKACRGLEFSLETGIDHNLTSARLHKFVDDLQIAFGEVSDAIATRYFQ